ncbi:hypothetical protein RFI_07670 [Reticulomyxa filosa]|uniref:Uncharacterized protein n=1 Tax=Reticulomyxa filosa TaxID=46433 RepID=X6NUJ2_RETFI|nr:hypothetical protein RFI_07670 [Reticulomyxa filosa]|eukprot:ETO29449.1 hypothetical protein RFI_07670 [Reticulomyxa filosa]
MEKKENGQRALNARLQELEAKVKQKDFQRKHLQTQLLSVAETEAIQYTQDKKQLMELLNTVLASKQNKTKKSMKTTTMTMTNGNT